MGILYVCGHRNKVNLCEDNVSHMNGGLNG